MASLKGRRILIVEDEMLLAMDLEEVVQGWGADVIGPVPTIEKALTLLSDHRPDAVTLDMNLSGASSLPLARELAERNIPFVVVSGYNEVDPAAEAMRTARFVKKPFNEKDLLKALEDVLA
jgi:DNA-binding NtrC family response regulator